MMKKVIAVFLSMTLCGCASITEKDLSHITPEGKPQTEEQIVGAEIHQQILSQFYPYTDPRVVGYVNDVGRELAKQAKRKDLRYQVTVLYNEKIYATSAPGGYIYITTGMLNFLQNEAELAAVLAHEVAQLQFANPHFVPQNQRILNTATQAGTAIAPMFGPLGSLGALGLVLLQAYNDSSRKTPEERLLKSDVQAMRYLVKAGYDPQALLDIQEHFLRAGEKMAAYFYDYYQSRPITEERMKHMKKEFQKLPLQGKELRTDPVEYHEVMKGVREIYRASV